MPFDFWFEDLLRMGSLLMYPLLSAAGIVICYRFRHLSSRLTVMLVGFALECVEWTLNLLPFLVGIYFPPFFRLAGFAGTVLVIVGLALVLSDLRRRVNTPATGSPFPRDRLPTSPRVPDLDDLSRWRDRPEGSRDIRE